MKLFDSLHFAFSSVSGHKLRTFLSVLGVTIGVASVIMLTSLGEGARLYVTDEFAQLGSTLIIVLPGKSETTGGLPVFGRAPNDLTIEDARAIAQGVRGARMVAPLAIASMQAATIEKKRDCMVVGTTNEFTHIRALELYGGRFLPKGDIARDFRVCVLGSTIKQELFGNRNALGENIQIGGSKYRVIGVVASSGTSIGGNIDEMVFIPVSGLLRMLNSSGLFRIFVEIERHDEIDAVSKKVIALIKKRHNNVEDITIFTQGAVLSTFDKILSILTYALGGIAAISLTVAGVGIMNVMLVSVSERTSEIGLLKALGATRFQIMKVFILEAGMLSAFGGLIGLLFGVAAANLLRHFYPTFPAEPPQWAVIAAVFVSVGVGLLFGILPARRASRLDPIAALSRR